MNKQSLIALHGSLTHKINTDPEADADEKKVMHAALGIAVDFLRDVGRIADALDQLAGIKKP